MLLLRYLQEDFGEAKEVLSNWEYDRDSVDEMFSYYRISANMIYPYKNKEELCFLRMAPVSEKEEKNLRGEIEFLEYLKQNGYPCLHLIPAKSGETLLRVKTNKGEFFASSFTKVEGEPIEETDYGDDIMLAYGRSLGRLHNLSRTYQPKVKKWTHQEYLSWMAQVLVSYQGSEAAIKELHTVNLLLASLPKTEENYGLIHGDFEPDNVFFDECMEECNAIDFEDGMYHWYVYDVMTVFEELMENLDEALYARARDKFLEGYKEESEFSIDAAAKLPAMKRFADLLAYCRAIRCVDEEFDEEPEWMGFLREKLGEKIGQYEETFEKYERNALEAEQLLKEE